MEIGILSGEVMINQKFKVKRCPDNNWSRKQDRNIGESFSPDSLIFFY